LGPRGAKRRCTLVRFRDEWVSTPDPYSRIGPSQLDLDEPVQGIESTGEARGGRAISDTNPIETECWNDDGSSVRVDPKQEWFADDEAGPFWDMLL